MMIVAARIREEVPEEDAPVRGAQGARGLDELAALQCRDLGPHDPRHGNPEVAREDQRGLRDGDRREVRVRREQQQERGKDAEHVGEAHERGVRRAAAKAGDATDRDADERGDQGREQGRLLTRMQSLQRPHEHQAADAVAAEDVPVEAERRRVVEEAAVPGGFARRWPA